MLEYISHKIGHEGQDENELTRKTVEQQTIQV